MPLVISDDTLASAQVSDSELRLEIAVLLFAQGRFTLGQASEFCTLPQFQFQKILGERKIPIHYDIEEFQRDMQTLRALP
jgi:predicted HTH domain antitoxin